MDIIKIAEITEGTIVCGKDRVESSGTISFAFASDLMSDVLRVDKENILLITGLCNTQTIRTAEMSDISYIIFARGKKMNDEMKTLAEENNMFVVEADASMYKICGLLYKAGLKPVY
jgi:hypothetical protein